ncbi:MAG: hypothetical protein HQM03_10920 [Magnetococcales bacterium]|nr:hypothetical protein [Magnetococcales bacterium]
MARLFLLFAALVVAGPLFAAEAPPPKELFGQYVDIDRADLKAKGKITLHRLQPLAGQLRLEHASGDPGWIFKTISPWNSGLSSLLQGLNIKQLALTDGDLLLDGRRVDLRLKKAVIPEGGLDDVTLQVRENGTWVIRTARMRKEPVPGNVVGFLAPFAAGKAGYERMEAAGDALKGAGWGEGVFGEGWRARRVEGTGERPAPSTATRFDWKAEAIDAPGLRDLAARIPSVAEMLRFGGKESAPAEALRFDRSSARVMYEPNGAVVIEEVRLEAPWLQVTGNGKLDNQGRLVLDLTASNAAGQKKRFRIN